jgi:hypothetical protein
MYAVEDLMKTAQDLCRLVPWLRAEYSDMAKHQLSAGVRYGQDEAVATVVQVVEACVSAHSSRLDELRTTLWKKICSVLANVCYIDTRIFISIRKSHVIFY